MTLSMDTILKIKNEQSRERKRSAKADRKKRQRDLARRREQEAKANRLNNFKKACRYANDF